MNLKRPTTMFAFFLLSISILSGFAFQDFAYAETGMSVSVNADEGSTTISVSGHTSVKNNSVQILVTSPNGNRVDLAQVMPDANGDFAKEIQVGALWKQDGMYTITIQQGSSTLYSFKLQAEVTGGTTAATSVSDSTLEESGVPSGIVTTPGKAIAGLTISADNTVEGSTTIAITGHTDRTNNSIQIVVSAPNGNIVSIDQVMPDANGDFMVDIEVGGSQFGQSGGYTVTAQQGESSSYKDSVVVEVIDGVVIPEFGTIAALILAVAIISIIAVSAKTRLSIMPKY